MQRIRTVKLLGMAFLCGAMTAGGPALAGGLLGGGMIGGMAGGGMMGGNMSATLGASMGPSMGAAGGLSATGGMSTPMANRKFLFAVR
jgi:hypothetical protein